MEKRIRRPRGTTKAYACAGRRCEKCPSATLSRGRARQDSGCRGSAFNFRAGVDLSQRLESPTSLLASQTSSATDAVFAQVLQYPDLESDFCARFPALRGAFSEIRSSLYGSAGERARAWPIELRSICTPSPASAGAELRRLRRHSLASVARPWPRPRTYNWCAPKPHQHLLRLYGWM